MTIAQTTAFDALLSAWNAHQRLRTSGASTKELVASRDRLDHARVNAAMLMA